MAEEVSQDILNRTGEKYRPGTAREVSFGYPAVKGACITSF